MINFLLLFIPVSCVETVGPQRDIALHRLDTYTFEITDKATEIQPKRVKAE